MFAQLQKTGKATGPLLGSGGTWTLTVEKVEGERLRKILLTFLSSEGKVRCVFDAKGGRVRAKGGNKGVLILTLREMVIAGAVLDGDAGGEKTLELPVER
jgi:hypothetical protein